MGYNEFVSAYVGHMASNPNARVYLGLTDKLGQLPDPSAHCAEVETANARALLAKADTLRGSLDSFDEELDLELAQLSLRSQIHNNTYTFNGKTAAAQCPSAGDDIGSGIFQLFINDPRPEDERLTDILGRVQGVPAYLTALLERLDTPVERWVQIEKDQVSGLPSLFETIVERANAINWVGAPTLGRAAETASRCLTDYVEALSELPTTTQFHVGEETAKKIIELNGNPFSLSDLHALATDFLARTNATIEVLRVKLAAKYDQPEDISAPDLQHYLNQEYRLQLNDEGLDGILDRYQSERAKILEFNRERKLFPVFEEQDMLILRTPPFLAPSIPAGAMVSPAPLREGTRRSLVYLTLSEALRDEHTEISIPIMMIHEGIPGHHLQLAWASKHTSPIRRMFSAMEHAEGWTTMLEDYMLDVGYGDALTDEIRFIAKRDIARIGARVAIDLYFMTGDSKYLDVGVPFDSAAGDPFAKAGSLLKTVTGFVDARVAAELNWYSQVRGYPLSYLSGNQMVWTLKRDFEAHNGGRSHRNDQLFHETYLRSGNMPLTFLRRVFQNRGFLSPVQ